MFVVTGLVLGPAIYTSAAQAQSHYTYTILNAPGSTSTDAAAVNNSGEVVGTTHIGSNDQGYAYAGGSYSTFLVPGSTATYFSDVNNRGAIVGSYSFGGRYYSFPQSYGFLYQGSSYTLFDPPGSQSDAPLAINNSGLAVGESVTGAVVAVSGDGCAPPVCYYISNGYMYNSATGAFTTLTPPGTLFGAATDINSAGQVVGDGDPGTFLYSGGTDTFLTGLSGTNGRAINDSGVVVGTYRASPGEGSFIYNSGVYTPLKVAGSFSTIANDINSSGQVVGWYFPRGGPTQGFVYSGGTYTTIDVPGAAATYVTSINDVGQIAGYFYSSASCVTGGCPASAFVATNGVIETLPTGGTATNPIAFSGEDIGELTGAIGGLDSTDFYEFNWSGGNFSANASVTGAKSDGSYLFELVTLSGTILEQMTLDSADGFGALISDAGLAAGDYEIGLIADSADDPNVAITFGTPVNGTAVPEPASLPLLGSAGALLWLASRRKPRKELLAGKRGASAIC